MDGCLMLVGKQLDLVHVYHLLIWAAAQCEHQSSSLAGARCQAMSAGRSQMLSCVSWLKKYGLDHSSLQPSIQV